MEAFLKIIFPVKLISSLSLISKDKIEVELKVLFLNKLLFEPLTKTAFKVAFSIVLFSIPEFSEFEK